MYSKKRIITMTKLAIYDQKYGDRDKKSNEFYRHDYIYRKNMWTRLCASFAGVILLGLYWINQIFVHGVNFLTDIDYKKAAIDAAIFVLILMAIYTLIGTIREAREYSISQRRLKNYLRTLALLDRTRDLIPERNEEETGLYYGSDTANKRSDNSYI